MEVLLVKPDYHDKYPPLGLMKISAFHKEAGDLVSYRRGIDLSLDFKKFDIVYITSLFTYDIDIVVDTIKFYKEECKNAGILVGGIAASLMPKEIKDRTGIDPVVGVWDKVEFIPPDYSLFPRHKWGNCSFVFTSRGCPNNCSFCAVNCLEPQSFSNPRWKEHINNSLPEIMIHDNNITSASISHYVEVMEHLRGLGKLVTFDNGFDCRLFNSVHCWYLSKVKLKTIRFAFDSMNQDGLIQDSIKLCLNNGIPKNKILVYVLYNYNDTVSDALYRTSEVAKFGVRPYAMKYIPLNARDMNSFFSKGWDLDLCNDFFEFINIRRLANSVDFFEWRRKWKNKH